MWSATERVTTVPMPIMAKRPMSTPGPMIAPAPMVAPAATRTRGMSSGSSEESNSDKSGPVARGKRSLVKIVPAEIMTPSSMVTPAQI